MLQHQMNTVRPQRRMRITPNLIAWALVLILLATGLSRAASRIMVNVASVSSGSLPTNAADPLTSTDRREREQAIAQLAQAARGGSSDGFDQLAAYFQRDESLTTEGLMTARAIASIGSRQAYQALIRGLRGNQPATRRMAAMAALEESAATVTPLLISSLQDGDAGVRAGSAELLGYRHEVIAAGALSAATYDAEPSVREAAVWALGGDLAIWQSLPRMQLLQVSDPDARVQDAAHLAEARIRSHIARALALDPSDVLLVTVAPANGLFYVATPDDLYVLRDSTTWRQVGALPDTPTALSAGGADGQVVTLGTVSKGPFRSLDGGQTWQPNLVEDGR